MGWHGDESPLPIGGTGHLIECLAIVAAVTQESLEAAYGVEVGISAAIGPIAFRHPAGAIGASTEVQVDDDNSSGNTSHDRPVLLIQEPGAEDEE